MLHTNSSVFALPSEAEVGKFDVHSVLIDALFVFYEYVGRFDISVHNVKLAMEVLEAGDQLLDDVLHYQSTQIETLAYKEFFQVAILHELRNDVDRLVVLHKLQDWRDIALI